jgi:hypothetical protein
MPCDEEIGLTLLADVPGHRRAYLSLPPETVERLGMPKAVAAMRNALNKELARRGWPNAGRCVAIKGEVQNWTTLKL